MDFREPNEQASGAPLWQGLPGQSGSQGSGACLEGPAEGDFRRGELGRKSPRDGGRASRAARRGPGGGRATEAIARGGEETQERERKRIKEKGEETRSQKEELHKEQWEPKKKQRKEKEDQLTKRVERGVWDHGFGPRPSGEEESSEAAQKTHEEKEAGQQWEQWKLYSRELSPHQYGEQRVGGGVRGLARSIAKKAPGALAFTTIKEMQRQLLTSTGTVWCGTKKNPRSPCSHSNTTGPI